MSAKKATQKSTKSTTATRGARCPSLFTLLPRSMEFSEVRSWLQ
jgi:hypothetical protein